MAESLYHEKYRPQFHFTAKSGWLNDPNGLVCYCGEYHLFFQHNPFGTEWGNMTWGHAVSPDLVHWEQLENALAPDRMGTMFSGSAIVDWENSAGFQNGDYKTLVAIYTAAGGTSEESKGQPFTQCIAYSNDLGRHWTKYDGNPVLGHIVKENRDPKIVWHAPSRRWIMALYLDGPEFALFSSPDLKEWTRLQTLSMPEGAECPDFFELAAEGEPETRKWIFTAANGRYFVGDFDGKRYRIESGSHVADYGANYYAVQTYSDIPPKDGRRIQVAWMNGGKYPGMPFNQQMSFPCEMILRRTADGYRIRRRPVKEIEILHEKPFEWRGTLKPDANPLSEIDGDLFDLRLEFEPGRAKEVALTVGGEPVRYDSEAGTLTCLGRSAPLSPKEGRVTLQILADRTSLEVFGNDGEVAFTSCFLPPDDAKGLSLSSSGGDADVVSMKAFPLRSAWKAPG
jgi:sucrose-6-phosphate hydrolase SacC (GH32 family)